MADPSPLRIAVLDDYQQVAARYADWSALGTETQTVTFHDHVADRGGLAARLADYDVLVLTRERTRLDAALVAALPRLKLVVTMGMWNAAIDLAACRARNVPVCGTAGGDPEATPALTWGLILAITRGIAAEAASVRAGGWQVAVGADVAGKTLGVLGLGRIGRRVAQFGRTFGMTVVAWSPNLSAAAATEAGAERVDKDELFRRADVLTIHLKLGERSRGIVGRRELGLLRPEAFLVNTSRGPIVDEAALVEALEARRIAGAALDVFETEPLPPHHPFRSLPNVLATPHVGYVSRNTYAAAFPQMVENIAAWRAGRPIRILEP